MCDADENNDQPLVVDFVQYAVVTNADSPQIFGAGQLQATRWSRVVSQCFNCEVNATAHAGVQLAHALNRSTGQFNLVHDPRLP